MEQTPLSAPLPRRSMQQTPPSLSMQPQAPPLSMQQTPPLSNRRFKASRTDGEPLPSSSDWAAVPVAASPRSLQPPYTVMGTRREISAYADGVAGRMPWNAAAAGSASYPAPPRTAAADVRLPTLRSETWRVDKPPATARTRRPPSRHPYAGEAPSNRSEAAVLTIQLEQQLAALRQSGRNFRAELNTHNAAFAEVVRQVSVHCAERGELLRRLMAFYTRSTDATARMAEQSMREKLQADISTMEQEIQSVRALGITADGTGSADTIKHLFDQLSEEEKAEALVSINNETVPQGAWMLRDPKDPGTRRRSICEPPPVNAPPPVLVDHEERVRLIESTISEMDDDQRAELLAALAPSETAHQLQQGSAMMSTMSPEVRTRFLHENIDAEQGRQMALHHFEQTESEEEKVELLADLMQSLPVAKSSRILAKSLHALDDPGTLLEMNRLLMAKLDEASQAQLLRTQLGSTSVANVLKSLTESLSTWSAADKRHLVSELLSQLSSADQKEINGRIMEGLRPRDRQQMVLGMLNGLDDADMLAILPEVLPMDTALAILREKLSTHDFLQRLTSESGMGDPAYFVAKLYRVLQQPAERCQCLKSLCKHDDFGQDELQTLVDHLKKVSPMIFESRVIGAAAGAESLVGDTSTPKVIRRSSVAKPPPQLMTLVSCVRLLAGIVHRKVKEDTLADQKGKPHVRVAKFSRDFLMRQYGTKTLAENHLRDLVHSVQHYAGDEETRSAAEGAAHLQHRFHFFGEMLGVIEQARPWDDSKCDFYLAFLARCLSFDQPVAASVAAARKATSSTRRTSVANNLGGESGAADHRTELLFKSVAMPPNMREVLLREELTVKLSSALACLELFVTSEGARKELQEQVSKCSFVQEETRGQHVVNLDLVMTEAEDARVSQRTAGLGELYDQSDLNDHGLLDFAELRLLSDRSALPQPLDALTSIFDRAALMSAEQMGEEMDSITREAFVAVSIEHGLFEPADSRTFIEPRALIAQQAPLLADGEAAGMGGGTAMSFSKASKSMRGGLSKSGKFSMPGGAMSRTMRSAVSAFSEAQSFKRDEKALVRVEKPASVSGVIKSALRQNFLFKHLPESLLEEVVGYMAEQTVRVDDVVIKEGTSGDYFYVAESGGFEVLVKGERVHTYEVSKSEGKHPCFGELSLMYAKPRAASIVATADGVLWKLGRNGFRLVQAQANNATDPYMVLRKVEFFRGLRFDQMQRLRDRMREIDFDPGETIFQQGEIGDGMYIIAKGQVSVHKREAADSREVMTLSANTYFGERALLRNEPRAASVTASDQVKTLFISRQEFEAILGPLQELLDEDRRKREHTALARTKELEANGLADATRTSFRLEAPVTRLPCGEVYLATHLVTGECYTLRQEAKEAVVASNERERVQRESAILRSLNEMQAREASRTLGSLQIPF